MIGTTRTFSFPWWQRDGWGTETVEWLKMIWEVEMMVRRRKREYNGGHEGQFEQRHCLPISLSYQLSSSPYISFLPISIFNPVWSMTCLALFSSRLPSFTIDKKDLLHWTWPWLVHHEDWKERSFSPSQKEFCCWIALVYVALIDNPVHQKFFQKCCLDEYDLWVEKVYLPERTLCRSC